MSQQLQSRHSWPLGIMRLSELPPQGMATIDIRQEFTGRCPLTD